ncbi:MAG: right-handed parallel beta-helix repeat-containing protein [Candidatus Bipolaricaulota bacterium]|nr:right-handed parallel beta-helix repeat-containing protein [Candidatus Bipolaricaulota bacterium]MDW8126385.1 right-handed parallel beta-helix repeat-containing protein [Candidatus Bipolaricaulota bacterium]
MRRAISLGALLFVAVLGLAQERGPIIIRSDLDFTQENGVVSGTGNADDPFLIAGWTIRVPSGTAYGIYIENTTKSFIIRGCTVLGAQDSQGAAIAVVNVRGGVIEDCLVRDSINGVIIQSSQNLVMRDNFLAVSGVGLQVLGTSVQHYDHVIEPTNSVNGKPVYYLYGVTDMSIADLDAGHITLAGARNVTLRGAKIDQTDGITVAFSEQVRLENLDISRPRGNGVTILSSPHTQVRDSPRIANSKNAGIAVILSDYVRIENCGIYANLTGVYVNASDHFVVENTAFAAGPIGVHITGASREPVVRKNLFYQSSYGVKVESALGPVVEACAFWQGDIAVFIDGQTRYARVSRNSMVSYGYGVSNFGSDGIIELNHITRANIGIIFEEAYQEAFPTGNIVRYNLIYRSYDGFYFGRESRDTQIYENLVWSCQRWARDFGQNLWAPQGRGNWYSNYQGTDTNGDGVGDSPVSFAGGGRDPSPLMSREFLPSLPGVLGTMERRIAVLTDATGQILRLPVLLADEAHERFMGFMGVPPELATDLAIMFVFDTPTVSQFHMQNVFLPLEILFFSADGSFLGRNRMSPDTQDRYGAASPFLSALEVPEGKLSSLGREVRLLGLE